MDLIVAVDNNWAIGNKGNLLVSIPEDQKFMRQITMGNQLKKQLTTLTQKLNLQF